VPWFGKSCGRYFQGIPVRLTYRIALKTSRSSTWAGWPVLALDGPPSGWLPGMLMRGVRRLPVRW